MAYPQVEYAADQRSATVTIVYELRDNSTAKALFQFGPSAPPQRSNTAMFTAESSQSPLTIAVHLVRDSAAAGTLVLPDIDFLWNSVPVPTAPQYKSGQRGGILEMFGWPYADIQEECAAIAKAGWLGVKVFPPQESLLPDEWMDNGMLNPWYFMYQPVSY